jgi:hypothetical protein
MSYQAGREPDGPGFKPGNYVIPTESLLRLHRTLLSFEDVIDLDDAKRLLELVTEELTLRASDGEVLGPPVE